MFNSPMTLARADMLIEVLALEPGSMVSDIGCGEAAFLRRLARQVQVNGVGYDSDKTVILEAEAAWHAEPNPQGSTLSFSATETTLLDLAHSHANDLLVCIGGEFIFGGLGRLLDEAKTSLKHRGRLLVGTIYWKQPPSEAYLALMGGENPHFDLVTTVQMAYDTGYLPLGIYRSSDDEWDTFESSHARKRYLTAIEQEAPSLRERAWAWQHGYLEWGMTTMGFCFMVLQRAL